MPFWGMSKAGREAEGWPREYGAWTSEQFKNWLGQMQAGIDRYNWLTPWAITWAFERANRGIGTPEDIRTTGQQVMPGVDEAIRSRQERWERLTPGQQTMEQVRGTIDELGGEIASREKRQQDIIREAMQSQMGREAEASKDITEDILRRYEDLQKRAGETYGGLKEDIERLNPASEAAQARIARSFGGQMADTMARLRRGGIDPNSPMAAAAIRAVETARSRAMDDAAVEGTEKYLASKMGLGLGELEHQTGLSREQGALGREEAVRHTTARNVLEDIASGRFLDVGDKTYGRVADWLGRKGDAALLQRAMEQQDWQTQSQMDLDAINLRNQQFGAGMDYTLADLAERNIGRAQVGDIGQQSWQQAVQAANVAGGFGDTAARAYQTAYGYEAPNAGWGKKLLGGAVGMAAPVLGAIPAVGPYLAAGARGLSQGLNQSRGQPHSLMNEQIYGGTQYGGGWGGPTNPYVFSAAQGTQAAASNPYSALYSWRKARDPNYDVTKNYGTQGFMR